MGQPITLNQKIQNNLKIPTAKIRIYWLGFILMFLVFGFTVLSGVALAYEIKLSSPVAWTGKVITVAVVSAEGVTSVKAKFLGKTVNCFKQEQGFRGIIGVPVEQKPGYYKLKLIFAKQDGTVRTRTKQIKVWATKFPFSKFWLKPSRNKLRTRRIINNEWAQIEKVLLVESSQKKWRGAFSWPVKDRVSQAFGFRQIINGKKCGAHRGVDIAVPSGTPIKAPNRGKVVFAQKLKAFGGTMVVDHGQGIQTLYFHLSKLIAKVGQEVEAGTVIALSGNSGISSGAHLHWGMSVHNLRVDPLQWIKHEI